MKTAITVLLLLVAGINITHAEGERFSPAPTWQWQLSGTVNTSYNVAVYDIDLFDSPSKLIAGLHDQGRRVICYFSAGSYEDWRPDAYLFPSSAIGKSNGWPGERWLDIRNPTVREIMSARISLAVQKGCDAVEPDNVDGYANRTGFNLSQADAMNYLVWLAETAHTAGISVGLKNAVELASSMEPYFDFTVNEECFRWKECGELAVFINHGKAVFNAEYQGKRTTICAQSIAMKFSTLFLPLALDDSSRYSCL